MKLKNLHFLLLFLMFSTCILAQNSAAEKEYYKWFDAVIGLENTGLYNGVEYVDFEKGEEGFTKFLYVGDFRFGEIEYDGQTYYDIPLIYNVYDDEAIIKAIGASRTTILQLFKEKVSSFKIYDKSFTKIENRTTEIDEDKLSGFYEVLFNASEIEIYKKHRKGQLRKIKKQQLFFEYKPKNPYYFLAYQNKVYAIKNKRDFIKIFPDFKNEINEVGVDGSVRRNNPDAYILAYAKQINLLLSKN